MKESLLLPPSYQGDLWFYDKDKFLNHAYQSFLHRHDELELNLVVRGRGTYLLNSRRVELMPNSALWLFPEQEHLLLAKSLDFEMWILVAKPNYLREICTDLKRQVLLEGNPDGNYCRGLSSSQVQKLSGLCKDTMAIKEDLSFFNTSLGYILLSAWAAFQTASSTGPEKNIPPVIDQAVKLMIDSMGANDLQFLAGQVGLSPSSLSRLFKKQMGVSITTFRSRCRVEQFLDLYGDGQMRTMLDAALEAGFGSYAQFYRVFKQIMGGNPSDYRRNLSNNVHTE